MRITLIILVFVLVAGLIDGLVMYGKSKSLWHGVDHNLSILIDDRTLNVTTKEHLVNIRQKLSLIKSISLSEARAQTIYASVGIGLVLIGASWFFICHYIIRNRVKNSGQA